MDQALKGEYDILQAMSKRLQVVMTEEEYAEIRTAARLERMTVAEWVRQSLRAARAGNWALTADEKLDVVRNAIEHSFPTGDIEEMLADIARGRSEPVG